jgi:hypothetical protein
VLAVKLDIGWVIFGKEVLQPKGIGPFLLKSDESVAHFASLFFG